MIVTVVRFPLSQPVTLDEARDQFGANAAAYLDVPGLLFKAYLRGDEGNTAGGVYWWADRASAEAKFNDVWHAGVTAKYGTPPTIEYFDAPVIVDAQQQVIRTEPPLGKRAG